MIINVLKSKIHCGTVTGADLNYEGSIGISSELVEKANMRENEKVDIYNITNGNRLSTYIILEPANSGKIVLNGAAARLVQPGDKVIIASYCWVDEKEEPIKPLVLLMDENNNPLVK